jgi:hypothetical protein
LYYLSTHLLPTAVVLLASACSPQLPEPDGAELPSSKLPDTAHPLCADDDDVVIPLPERYADLRADGYDRYTELLAPDGQPIRILAQDGPSTAQILRARNLLRFYLTDVAGSSYGSDKGAVLQLLADNMATLALPNGADGDHHFRLEAQPLYQDELPVEGSAWYLDSDYEHRDAAFEEIFHLVHDMGIGTDWPGALPAYQQALLAEAEAALEDGRWGIPVDPEVEDWIRELRAENSLAQEYIAAVIDSYYGLWGAWDEAPGGMWGIYIAKTRDEVLTHDPAGAALLEAFLPPAMAGYEAILDPAFEGVFSTVFDADEPYTHRSRYLVTVRLTGSADSGILGNDADNILMSNDGDNTLDGGEGEDSVVVCEYSDQISLSAEGEGWILRSSSGEDRLLNIEWIHALDGLVEVGELGR